MGQGWVLGGFLPLSNPLSIWDRSPQVSCRSVAGLLGWHVDRRHLVPVGRAAVGALRDHLRQRDLRHSRVGRQRVISETAIW